MVDLIPYYVQTAVQDAKGNKTPCTLHHISRNMFYE